MILNIQQVFNISITPNTSNIQNADPQRLIPFPLKWTKIQMLTLSLPSHNYTVMQRLREHFNKEKWMKCKILHCHQEKSVRMTEIHLMKE